MATHIAQTDSAVKIFLKNKLTEIFYPERFSVNSVKKIKTINTQPTLSEKNIVSISLKENNEIFKNQLKKQF